MQVVRITADLSRGQATYYCTTTASGARHPGTLWSCDHDHTYYSAIKMIHIGYGSAP